MTVPTITALNEAKRPLLTQFSATQAQPGYLAAVLRTWLSKEFQGAWQVHRGAMQLTDGLSATYEGLLLDPEAQPLHEADGFVLVQPECVRGMVQVITDSELLPTLANWAEDCQSLTTPLPLVLWLAGKPSDLATKMRTAWEQAPATPPLNLVVSGQSEAMAYAPASKQWHAVVSAANPQQGPDWSEALALTRLALMNTEPKLAWVKVAGCKTQPLPPAPTAKPPSPVAVPPAPSRQTSAKLHNPDEEGLFPLHHAAMTCDRSRAEQLLLQGAATEVKDREGNTPLHLAVVHQHLDLAQLLLDFDANPNHRNYLHQTPLHLAAEERATQLIPQLIKKGAQTEIHNHRGMTPLHVAVRNGCQACVQTLIEAQAQLEASMDRQVRPLHLAAWFGHVELVTHLLAAGAEINATDAEGNTPLHFAAFNGQVKTIKTLINHRADMQIRNRAGASYLNGISEGKQAEMVAFMEKK